jgi:hypothetical protein
MTWWRTVIEGAPEGVLPGLHETEVDRVEGDTIYLRYVPTDYLLLCRTCHPSDVFDSAQARGHAAANHTRETGHDSWLVEQRRTETS